MLNWKVEVNETSKKNVQSLYDQFDRFIMQNHSTQFSYDQKVRIQWEAFKTVLTTDPSDVEAHSKYVNYLKGNRAQSTGKSNFNFKSQKLIDYQNITPILMQINRDKLEQMAKKSLRMISNNNKFLI